VSICQYFFNFHHILSISPTLMSFQNPFLSNSSNYFIDPGKSGFYKTNRVIQVYHPYYSWYFFMNIHKFFRFFIISFVGLVPTGFSYMNWEASHEFPFLSITEISREGTYRFGTDECDTGIAKSYHLNLMGTNIGDSRGKIRLDKTSRYTVGEWE